MKKLLILIIIFSFVSSCITFQAPTTPAAASAVAGTLMIAKYAMPVVMAVCIGVLVAKRSKEFNSCKEPISPDMVVTCDRLREAEEVRKQNTH